MLKDLLTTADLTPADLAYVLDLAAAFKAAPRRSSTLERETVVLYFNKASTRTRVSFETAVARLGGTPIMVGPSDLQLGRGETIEDTARVVSRYARAFVIRTFADDDVRRFAAAASIPVVNALTDLHHPCQSLADLLTLRERLGPLVGRRVAYVGAGNNVAHSLLEAGALAGLEVRIGTPRDYGPDPRIVARARVIAATTGARIVLTHDPGEAVAGVDAVYTDVWTSMGDTDSERELRARIAALVPFQVNAELLAYAAPHAIFLHCLPDHRGEEVTADVVDGPRSVVFDQAENRLHTAVAVLEALLGGALAGQPEVLL
ncbi:MAG: ornithine carbamoyltransferase [Deltaproteobacteria bacterium]|nr:ornithine carbamoyltransferase [Deltaproteobacteria bacterium]